MNPEIQRITVIGAGTMGHGIAQVGAVSGHRVTLHDSNPETLPRALANIRRNLDEGIGRGKLAPADRDGALDRLKTEPDLTAAVAEADLVIEAVVEDLSVKQTLLRRIEPLAPAETVLASNTSSIPITKLASVLQRPERMLGMHFFNPVHIMKLVEVVVHEGTAASVRETILRLARQMGKEPIVVKDSPGFASSRLGVTLGLEAMRMLEEGVASAADIDTAMELGYKHPMGPLKLTDLVGLDVRLAIAETLHRELESDRFRPPEILKRKVAAGELGKKSGQGFYPWPG
jgi:3-hydroxybutyryl-CoA dehydrogenase